MICKLVRVFHGFSQVGDSNYMVIHLVIQSMGRIPLSQSIKIKNSAKSPFLNVDLVLKDGFKHKGQNMVTIEIAYIPHAHALKFLQNEQGDMQIAVEWNIFKNLSLQLYVKKLMINNHLEHTWYGFKTYKPFPLVIFSSFFRLVVLVFFYLIKWKLCFVRMNVVMGWKTITKTPTAWGQSNAVVWPTFPSRGFKQPNAVEIPFYHQTHTPTNGDPIHGACDPRSTSRMSAYAPCVFNKLKEFIWTQLGLSTLWNKFMTSIKKFGGHRQMWVSGWPMMISHDSKISPTWTKNARGALGVYT